MRAEQKFLVTSVNLARYARPLCCFSLFSRNSLVFETDSRYLAKTLENRTNIERLIYIKDMLARQRAYQSWWHAHRRFFLRYYRLVWYFLLVVGYTPQRTRLGYFVVLAFSVFKRKFNDRSEQSVRPMVSRAVLYSDFHTDMSEGNPTISICYSSN